MRAVLPTVILGDVLVMLGLAPMTVILPGLIAALDVEPTTGAWLLTAFILALAGCLLVAGRLGDLVGHRRVFVTGALVYSAASLMAAVAPGFEVLLVARVIQGVGAALVSGNNLAILTRAVPESLRGRAVSFLMVGSSASALVASVAASWLVSEGAWRMVFWLTVPFGLAAAWRARQLPDVDGNGSTTRIDWLGAGLLVVAFSALALALNHPHGTSSEIVMPVYHQWLPLLAIVVGGVFVAVERRANPPLMDWARLRSLPFATAMGVNAVIHLTMMALMFLAPVVVERGLGMGAVASTAVYVAVLGAVMAMSLAGGWLHDRVRWPYLRAVASFVVALGFFTWAFAAMAQSYAAMLVVGAIAGLGNGLVLALNTTLIMGALPAPYRGAASGMLETTRHFGHALGVTIPTAIVAFAGDGAADDAAAMRWGFALSCVVLGSLTLVSVGLAARQVPAARPTVERRVVVA
jgi:MFS family permease